MLTELQKLAAQAIVNVFETGRATGHYGQVTLLAGDTGHLTYGRAQTTLASGNLFLLIKGYVEAEGAALAAELAPYLEPLAARDTDLDHDEQLHELLRRAGADPAMRRQQDRFFDRVYWEPSVRSAGGIEISTALGIGVVYDSRIHGSWPRMRDRTSERHGRPADIGERDWVGRYVEVRRDWLANHSNELLHRTVYRMDAFGELIGGDRWTLELPFTVRGVRLDEQVLTAAPDEEPAADVERPSADDGSRRLLRVESPLLEGDDVRAVQQALIGAGFELEPDGVYGPQTAAAVEAFQAREGLVDDGIVGPATRAALGLD